MIPLPIEIEEKITNLPVINFGESEAFQTVIFSDDFDIIFQFYKENYLPDVLKTKPDVEQRVSLYLSLTNQDESFVEQTNDVLYRRPVPDIHTFLSDDFYMGRNNATLYQYWRDQLEEIFKEGSPVRKTIFGGSIGCLVGDTEIATLSGNKKIRDFINNYHNDWVLSFNTATKSWEPDKVIDAFSTGIKDIYEITLDNGETIRCTSNHLFLTRKNKWLSIDTGLKSGMSMMPYYEQISKTGYIQVKNNITEKFENRYQIVGKWKSLVKKGIAIHHKNINKLDDRPENLCLLPYKVHYNYHSKLGGDRWREYNASIRGEEFKEYRSNKAKKANITYKNRPDYEKLEKKRKQAWLANLQDFEHQSNAGKAAWIGEKGKLHKKQASATLTARNKSEKARNTSKLMAENMRKLLAKKTKEEIVIINLKKALPSIKKYKGISSEEYKNRLKKIHEKEPWYNPEIGAKANYKLKQKYNHKIISIKHIGKEEVFDLTTQNNHNFALKSGIIAHNSGKSTVARKAFVYVLYRILCLRYPRATFNIDADATIACVIISMTLKQVYDTNLLPFVKLLESMPCFQKVQSVRSFDNFDLTNPNCPIPFTVEKSSGTIFFPDNIIITCGSNAGHFTGYNVVNSFCFTEAMKVQTQFGPLTFKNLLRRFNHKELLYTQTLDCDGNLEKTKIIDVKITGQVKELIKIYYDDWRYIECTPTHPFIIKNPKPTDTKIIWENNLPYKLAKDLTEEDELYDINDAYVYALLDNTKPEKPPFYIGVGSHTALNNKKYLRAYYHFSEKSLRTSTNPYKNKIIRKIKKAELLPEIKILKDNISLNDAFDYETECITKYGKVINTTGILTNITNGGDGASFISREINKQKNEKIKQTKKLKKEQQIKEFKELFNQPLVQLFLLQCLIEHKQQVHINRSNGAKKSAERSKLQIIKYNQSEVHRKQTAYLNSIKPKVSSKESKLKLSISQSLAWKKKSEKEKQVCNQHKTLGRAWNVLKRIDGNIINAKIYTQHRSKGSRLANTEPSWITILKKFNTVDNFLNKIEKYYNKRFVYED